MKIVAVNGGLHRGCRMDALIAHLLIVARRHQAQTTHHALCILKNLQKCQECGSCRRQARHCVLKDDLTPVLASLENADILVMGTPITGEDPTAYFKIFFERFYSFLKHDGSCRLPAGKKVVLVLSPGAAEGEFEKAVESFITWLQPFGFSELHWIICPQGGKNDAYEAIETVIGKLIGSSGQPA